MARCEVCDWGESFIIIQTNLLPLQKLLRRNFSSMDIFNLGYDNNRYPDGVQDFATIRNEDMVYVDKTEYVYHLTRKSKSYFLSRPRRFGKSLLLSTLSAYFEGRRELFSGLAIDGLEQEWLVYPVIRIDLSRGVFLNYDDSVLRLFSQLKSNADRLGVVLEEKTPDGQFYELIEKVYRKTEMKVVILIDEYDKPLLETQYEEETLHHAVQGLMRGFYGCVKAAAEYLRFVMITGITKVAHVNVFSGLNNLTDLSLQPWCNALCGISESEMQRYFAEDMITFARVNRMAADEVRAKFKFYYDGYRFAEYGENIYNPYSVILAFRNMKFSSYWFSSGTPAHLMRALSNQDFNFDDLEGKQASGDDLTGLAAIDSNPVGLLYQAGYLTIKDYDDDVYTLGFPNKEVESGFYNVLLQVQHPNGSGQGYSGVNMRIAAVKGEPSRMVELLDRGLNDYNYEQHKNIDSEAMLNNMLYGLVHAIGLNVKAEYHISNGRIDMVIETKQYVYLFEFKIDKTAAVAMQQINDKGYADKYRHDNRKLFKIALNYNTSSRSIDDYIIEPA